MKAERIYKILIFIFSIIIIGAIFVYFRFGSLAEIASGPNSISFKKSADSLAQRKEVEYLINKFDSQSVYDAFKEQYKSEHYGIQHSMAHIVGEMIFKKEGINGLSVCDSTFAFGCYHSFFSQALAEHGPNVIADLDAICIKKFGILGTGCQHGIGHGLVEYFGHDLEGLNDSLKECRRTNQPRPLAGCSSGVFMEFNLPIVLDDDNTKSEPRSFNPRNPYYPCDEVSTDYQDSCFYEIPQWWNNISSMHDKFEILGSLCEDIKSKDHRTSCFLGTGHVIGPSTDYSIELSQKNCLSMPSQEGKINCLSGASWSFDANPDFRSKAPDVCSILKEEDKYRCIKEAQAIIGT